jgi:WD40 repeat protein
MRADLEATNARKFRKISFGLLLLSVSLIVVILLAFYYEKRAEREAAILKFRDMVAKAIKDLDIDPEASVLVALRAADQASANAEKSEVDEAADALSRALSVSRTERLLRTGVDPAERLARVAYNHEGTRLATLGGESDVVQIWDVDTGRLYRSLEGNDEVFRTLIFAPEGNLLFITSNKAAEIWDPAANSAKPRIVLPLGTGVEAAAFSADGKRIAVAEHDGTLQLWDASTGTAIGGFENSKHEGVINLRFSPDGKYLATGSVYGTVAIWNVATGKERYHDRLRHNDAVTSVRFSPDGKLLATASMDATVKIWNAENGTKLNP